MKNKKKGRILYIGGFELPDKNAAAHRVIANSKAFEKLGFEIILIGVDKLLNSKTTIIETKSEYNGFVYYSIPYPQTIEQWISYLTSISFIKKIPDLSPTHIIAYNFPAIGLGRLITHCRQNKIKIIGDCTEWYQPTGNLAQKILKSADVYLRMRHFHLRLDGLIVISKYLNDFYDSKVKNVINIPPLVDLKQKKWPTDFKDSKTDRIEVIYAGSPGAGNKDRIDWLIMNLSKLLQTTAINIVISIVGITKEQYLKTFKIKSGLQHLDSFVTFYGRLEHEEVLKKINQAHFCFFLREPTRSNNAGFPTKFAEAISCGTPVLTNSTSNLFEFIAEKKTGFNIEISSFETFADSIMHAFSLTTEEIKNMKNFCMHSKMFHFEEYTNDFDSFFNKISNDK